MIGQAPTTCGAWTTRVGGHLATAAAPTAVTTPACDPATAAEVVDALELMHGALEQAVFVIAGSGLATEHAQAEWRCSHDRTTEARVPKGTVTSLRFAKERIRPPSVLWSRSENKANTIYACTTFWCSVHTMMTPAIRRYNPRTARSSNSLAPAVGPVGRGCAEGRKDDA